METERRNPYLAAAFSGVLFIVGALPSIIPFFFVESTTLGLVIAAIGSGVALFVVGAVKTLTTRKNPVVSGLENVLIAGVGAVVSFFVGSAFDAVA